LDVCQKATNLVPLPVTYYDLNVTATDAAGNTNTTVLQRVQIVSLPLFRPISPEWDYQQSNMLLHFAVNVSMQNFPGYLPDDVYLNVTPSGQHGIPPVYTTTFQPTGPTQDVWWNASAANEAPGPYFVTIASTRAGRSWNLMTTHVNLTSITLATGTEALSEATTLGTFNSTGEYVIYQFAYPNTCSTPFTIQLADLDANETGLHNVTFWIGDATATGTDATTYKLGYGTTGTTAVTPERAVSSPTAQTYNVLVEQSGWTNSTFDLRYNSACLSFTDSTRLPPEEAS
jgi:hypothetical protein